MRRARAKITHMYTTERASDADSARAHALTDKMMNKALLLSAGIAAAQELSGTTLTMTAGLQTGPFLVGSDIGSLNPHDCAPHPIEAGTLPPSAFCAC